VTLNKWCIGDGSAIQCTQDAPAGSSQWTNVVDGIIYNTSLNVGIGVAKPQARLDVDGAVYLHGGNIGIGTWSPTGKLQIVGTGNVGIGTTTPTALLQVDGTIYVRGTLGNVGIGSWLPQDKLQVDGGVYQTGNVLLSINSGNVGIGTTVSNSEVTIGGGTKTYIDGIYDLLVRGDIEVDGKIYGEKHLDFTLIDDASIYTALGQCKIPLVTKTGQAMTITNIEVTNNTSAKEVAGDLRYADNCLSFANDTLINDFDTTSGVRSDNTLTKATVPLGKCIYVWFDSSPDAAVDYTAFDITYN
jgi:hypothetical protein